MQEFLDTIRHVFIFLWAGALVSPIFFTLVNSEKTEIEFRAFRLQQYEYAGKLYGSKSWRVLYETVSLNRSVLRKCVIVNWKDLAEKDLETTIKAIVGAILVIIPQNFSLLSTSEKKLFLIVEDKFSTFSTDQAVYFAPYNDTLDYLLKSVLFISKKLPTAFQQLYSAIAANNFQISSENSASTNLVITKQYNIIGKLNANEPGKPYLVIVAHYDSHASIPALAKGVNSNGSGVAALLELLAILSQYYSTSVINLKYNIVFLLSAGGKFNYQGSRQWIDNFQENNLDTKIVLTICLDSLGKNDALNFHVSKALTPETAAHRFFENLRNFAGKKRLVNVITKKINLSAEKLAWEHEIFNVRRIHAITLSTFKNALDPMRNSILDDENSIDKNAFNTNVQIIANAIISFLFHLDTKLCSQNATNDTHFDCSLISKDNIKTNQLIAWLDAFGSFPRSIATLSTESNSKLIADLQAVVSQYADKTIVSEVTFLDFAIFGIVEDNFLASIVKPALFELFLALLIGIYLFILYSLAQKTQFILERAVLTIKKIN